MLDRALNELRATQIINQFAHHEFYENIFLQRHF